MIISATFSKPTSLVNEKLGKDFIKVKIRKAVNINSSKITYQMESFTEKQAFQKTLSQEELENFINQNIGITFKNAVITTETEETTYMTNRHGEVSKITRKIKNNNISTQNSFNKKKNYILQEGIPVPFLVKLGVMTKDGKVVAAKYDKFKQINRFLEYIDDIIDDVKNICVGKDNNFTADRPLYIDDFGCGKSYLTFAVYHYLVQIKNIPCEITGLDLKDDVIKECSDLANEFGYTGLHFYNGNVNEAEKYSKHSPDIMITLHACDTATDYALDFAVKNNCAAILSVPCCQHEINLQLNKTSAPVSSPFSSIEKWGILQERFAAIATDAIRGELLELSGYSVQMLEFIDMSHTPKNILIRGIKKASSPSKEFFEKTLQRKDALLKELNCSQTLNNLFTQK